MPDVPADDELTPLDSELKPTASAVGYSSADRPIGPTPKDASMYAAPGPVVRGVEEAGRVGAFAAGEAAGAVSPVPGGAALGAGASGTAADAVIAYINHKKYGTPIDMSKKALAEDFLMNAGTSAVFGAAGRFMEGGIPKEAEAIRDMAGKVESAQTTGRETITDAGQKALEKLKGQQDSQLGAISPQAQREAVERSVGGSAKDAAAAVAPPLEARPDLGGVKLPSNDTLIKQGDLRGVYFSVDKRLGDAHGAEYDKFAKQYGNNHISDVSSIRDTADDWEAKFVQTNRPVPPAVKDLIDDARDISPRSFLDTATAKVAGPLSASAKSALKTADERLQLIRPQEGEAAGVPTTGSTVDRILAFKRAAQKVMVKTSDPTSQRIAQDLADSANQTLGKMGGLPEDAQKRLAALNLSYADYKNKFPRADATTIATAQSPVEQADHIFNNPTLTDRIVSNATSQERQVLQDRFGDWAQLHSDKILAKGATRPELKADALIKSQVYGKLFPKSALADPNSIIYVGATMQNIEQAPQMKALFERSMQQAQQTAVGDGAKAVRDVGLKAAKDIGGPAGERLQKAIETANLKNPEAAAQVATQFFTGFTPQQFVQDLAKDQPMFGASLAQKSSGGFWMKRMISDPSIWPYIAGMGGVQAIMFGRSSWYLEMAAAGTPLIARKLVTNAFVKGLKDPAMAAALLNGTKAARIGVMGPLATTVTKAATDEMGSMLRRKVLDIKPLEPEAEDEDAGSAEAAQ